MKMLNEIDRKDNGQVVFGALQGNQLKELTTVLTAFSEEKDLTEREK